MKNKSSAAKGFVAGALVMALVLGTLVMASAEVRELIFGVSVTVNGEAVDFAQDSQPFIIDGRTFLPVRAIADALGFDIDWNPATQTVDVTTTVGATTGATGSATTGVATTTPAALAPVMP
ncbi:MAG: copper amine oxidase N-terminal domain-containing protein [Defluviitaleaceae bacterium]|nr:copper amine oxidase N-terminal domain-containing protein [Defluviitaleaceae bacterium]